jgi:hypothetical protein
MRIWKVKDCTSRMREQRGDDIVLWAANQTGVRYMEPK